MQSQNSQRNSERRSGMLLGAGVMLAGIVVGAALFGEPQSAALANVGGPDASLGLPAITLGPNEFALVADRQGRYLMIDTRGAVAPIVIQDTALRTGPGESIVMAR
jgi:MFS superfamily sulfate permease-like transporter